MPRTLPGTDAHQARLLGRADASAGAAAAAVGRVWLDLLRVMKVGGNWAAVFVAARAALHRLPAVAHEVAADLVAAHREAAHWTAGRLAATLPAAARRRLLRARGLVEDAASEADLLVGALLPPIDEAAVYRLVYSSGWPAVFARLTALAAPDALAARIASGVASGLSVQALVRTVKPVVEDVRASAWRVARTAGLWVAHEAERDVYRGLEGDLIAGYTVRAVLDARTRPAHRARDGHQFWCRPGPGQRGMDQCPHPPREADGSWAFNCRCWVEPILATG